MHECQIQKLTNIFRDLGIDVDFTKMVKWDGPDGDQEWEDVEGIFIDHLDTDKLIDALALALAAAVAV